MATMISVRLPDKLHAQLKRAAKAQHRPLATYVRLLLQDEVAWQAEADPLTESAPTKKKERAR